MAPSRPAPSLVVRTPRHASRRVRPALAAEIRRIVKQRNGADVELDEKFAANNPTHPLGVASDNASEWNSLLITARAERGPQWDVATQRFMVDYGSHLYFDSTPLTFPEERTPPPEDPNPQGPPPQDPSASWQSDPRYAQYGGNPNLGPVLTPSRTSLRLQHQQHQHPHPQQALNGHGNGNGMGNPYPYGLTNGRTPEQHQHQHQQYAQAQAPQSYYDGGQSHGQAQSQNHNHHAMTNGIAIGSPGVGVGAGSLMLGRQMSMGNMGMEFGGGGMAGGTPEVPLPDMRRRTRSQQDVNMEMGW